MRNGLRSKKTRTDTTRFAMRLAALFAVMAVSAALIAARPAYASQHAFVALVSHTAGLSDADRAFALAADAALGYALDSFPGIGMLPDSDVKSSIGKGEAAEIWSGGAQKAGAAMERLGADVLVVSRRTGPGGARRAEFRVYRKNGGSKIKSDKIVIESRGGIYAARKAALGELLKKIGAPADKARLEQLWIEKDGKSTELFAEGLKNLDDNRIDQGLAALESAARGSRDFRDANYFLGSYYALAQFNYDLAIKKLLAVKARYPSDATARYQLGFVYGLKGEYDRAAEEYEAAAKLKAEYYEARVGLAMLKYDAGEYLAAATNYRKALEIRPSAAQAWYSLAVCLSLSGKQDDAMSALKKAVGLAPDAFAKIARKDADLAALRNRPDFKKLMTEAGRQ